MGLIWSSLHGCAINPLNSAVKGAQHSLCSNNILYEKENALPYGYTKGPSVQRTKCTTNGKCVQTKMRWHDCNGKCIKRQSPFGWQCPDFMCREGKKCLKAKNSGGKLREKSEKERAEVLENIDIFQTNISTAK